MKNLATVGKIIFGLFGASAIFSSCAKEKDCKCTYSDGEYFYTITTKDKCENLEISYSYDGELYKYPVKCE